MNNDLTAFEKIPVKIFNTSDEGSTFVAREIASLIKSRQKENKPCVLGLATGSSPTRMYAELVKMHQKEGLSFKNVYTFRRWCRTNDCSKVIHEIMFPQTLENFALFQILCLR